MNNRASIVVLAGLVVGIAATVLWSALSLPSSPAATAADKPLYWVAPMDPDFRRDGPGKSPMGMDLIPVYREQQPLEDDDAGMVRISPEVVNNLGVRTAKVRYQSLPTAIKTVGYVQFDQDRLIHIHPRVAGWVETLHVKAAGASISPGQPLYTLYSPELVNAQEEFLLALNRNNTRLIKAAEQRLEALKLSREFIDTLKRRRQLQQTITFHASRAGVIDQLNIREGFYVQPGTTLMSIGSLEEVWVEAEVFERQAALVQVGQAVTMQLDYLPTANWQGRVDYVYPTLDATNRTARVRMRFDNTDGRLKPNMFTQVTIDAASDRESLLIPREALIRTGSQDRVVLAESAGHFRSVLVTVGRISPLYAEIVEGLSAGDSVVSSAQFLLDSESSKTADFNRMTHQPAATGTAREMNHD